MLLRKNIISFPLDKEAYHLLKLYAVERRIPISQILRRAVSSFMYNEKLDSDKLIHTIVEQIKSQRTNEILSTGKHISYSDFWNHSKVQGRFKKTPSELVNKIYTRYCNEAND